MNVFYRVQNAQGEWMSATLDEPPPGVGYQMKRGDGPWIAVEAGDGERKTQIKGSTPNSKTGDVTKVNVTYGRFKIGVSEKPTTIDPNADKPKNADRKVQLTPTETMQPGSGATGMLKQGKDVYSALGERQYINVEGKIGVKVGDRLETDIAKIKIGEEGSGDIRDGWVSVPIGKASRAINWVKDKVGIAPKVEAKVEANINVKNIVEGGVAVVATESMKMAAKSTIAGVIERRNNRVMEEVEKSAGGTADTPEK
jgi:hypothetical protein